MCIFSVYLPIITNSNEQMCVDKHAIIVFSAVQRQFVGSVTNIHTFMIVKNKIDQFL